MDAKFTIECVDAHALLHALNKQARGNMGYGLQGAEFEDSNLIFSVDRYAMNGCGYHVGTERFEGLLKLHPMIKGVTHGATPFSTHYVIPDELDLGDCEAAEEPMAYTQSDALEFLTENKIDFEGVEGDDLLQLAFDECMGDHDYVPPDSDFIYQELSHWLDLAMKDLPAGQFHWGDDPEDRYKGRHWTLGWPDEIVEVHPIDPDD